LKNIFFGFDIHYLMSTESKIQMFTKQNDSIFASLVARNIEFVRVDISGLNSPEDQLGALVDENNKLKEVVKANKPAPVPKEPKQVQATQPKKESASKEKNLDDEEEETFEEAKPKFNTITNMEDIKRAFCNKEYESFEALVQAHEFKYYRVQYKYASDKDGAPEFVAKNLVRGFVRNLEDYRKYLFVCFRCLLTNPETHTYSYPSMWIVNSTDPVANIIGSLYEDFEFVEVTSDNLAQFMVDFRKTNFDEQTNVVDELYAH
jgi:hypothetical protein